jgi:glycosyltransferase involved in cell wall biosynthesis
MTYTKMIYNLLKYKTKHFLNPKMIKPKQKTYEMWSNRGYESQPKITFIIQSHNKSEQVCTIVENLRKVKHSEIIVIDDGSIESHTKKLAAFLNVGNEFIIRANDLYEVITYDRAITMARGEYVVLLQDDDDFQQVDWVKQGIVFFEKYEKLAILGGRTGCLPCDQTDDETPGSHILEGDLGRVANLLKSKIVETPDGENGFKFVEHVNRAPMWIRRDYYLNKLGGADQSFAPFQFDDTELCLRAWTVGLQVGWYPARFKINALGTGGMRIWNSDLTKRQSDVNIKKLNDRYGDMSASGFFKELIEKANSQIKE